MKGMVERRRADIQRLIKNAIEEASRKNKQIETIDPLVACARRLFPYLPEGATHEYARTALRVIKNQSLVQTRLNNYQTTLMIHVPHL